LGKKLPRFRLEGRNVLPGAISKDGINMGYKAMFLGFLLQHLIATYGQNKLPLTAATRFTVVPKVVAIFAFVAAVAIVGFVLTLIVGRKRLAKILRVMFKG
jgi:hypothetical protein